MARRLPKPKVTLDDVREYLLRQEPASLVEIIMLQIDENTRLRESLLMKVARQRPGGLDVATFRAAIDAATDTGGFIPYREAYAFTAGFDNVVDSIAELLDAGHAGAVIELAEHALRGWEKALGQMDDSGGGMSPIRDRLQDLHHAACRKARPEPTRLARRLFQWEIEGDWDVFHGAAETYADVLGEKGLAVYRKLAQELWCQIPTLDPGDKEDYSGPRHRITSIMESLARASGDVEQLVAIKARDLSSPYHYLKIAEIYKEASLADKALEWAQTGLKAFPDARTDNGLEEFLADEYHRRRRHDEAMALMWGQFVRGMYLSSYRHLKEHADRAKQWPTWREKALGAIRSSLDAQKQGTPSLPQDPWSRRGVSDNSVLVDIFLWEGDAEAAWREAQAGGCDESLWMRLAEIRENDHPADALAIYRRQIDPMVNRKNNEAYRQVAKLLRKIKHLMARLDRTTEFPQYLNDVRKAHKPKRNFMAMLDDL